MILKQLTKGKPSKKSNQKVNFKFYAPQAKSVFVAGTFNNWNLEANPLRKNETGQWNTTLWLAPGKYEFRFLVDGTWECDPNVKECVPNPFGSWNCVINIQ